jgi:hypothetical protein
VPVEYNRPGHLPRLRRFTKPVWVTWRLRIALSWLPGPALQWLRSLVYFGRPLPLRHPRTFTERLLVKMGTDRSPLQTTTADRVAMRRFVEARLGPGYLPLQLAVLQDPDAIHALALPRAYVAKATHGSQMVHIVRDDSPAEREAIARKGKAWLAHDYWRRHGEWPYRHIPRRIVIEGYLGAPTEEPPADWKFYCFNGQVGLVSLDYDRFISRKRVFYDTEGRQLDLLLNYLHRTDERKPVPDRFNEMKRIAERLSAGFDFVRVDLFDLPDGIIVGELTHCASAGLFVWDPPAFDRELGDFWAASRPAPGSPGSEAAAG